MSIAVERVRTDRFPRGHPSPIQDPMGPQLGQNVPDDSVRAMRGVLWSVTVARIVLVPVFLVAAFRLEQLALLGTDPGRLRGGLVLTLAAIAGSDVLDGWIARRFGLATQAGAVVDAFADKLAQVALVAFFTFSGGTAFASLPLWFFVLIVGRDVVLGGGWLALRARALPFQVVHRLHGRAATVGVFAMLLWLTAGIEGDGFTALTLLTAALIWVSMGAYVADAWTAARGPREAITTLDASEGGLS
jgi:cardiolipin synthase (CMP-forming)